MPVSLVPTIAPSQPFTYLGNGIAIIFCIYAFLASLCAFVYFKYYRDEVYEFKSSYDCTVQKPYMNAVLGGFRVICFLFFLIFAGIYVWVIIYPGGQGYEYFTYWNVGLAFFYYFLATIASVLGLFFKPADGEEWSPNVTMFGKIHRIAFSVAGSSAFFITVVNFTLLSSEASFANLSDHLVTSITYLFEMFLSSTTVPVYNLFYMLTWAILWISVVCILYPATGVLDAWPYFFLNASNTGLYTWFPLLILLMIIFYFIWYGLSYVKVKYIIKPKENDVLYVPKSTSARLQDQEGTHELAPHGQEADDFGVAPPTKKVSGDVLFDDV